MIEWWMMKNDEQWWMTKNEWWSIMNDEWWRMNKLVTVPTPISWSQCQHQAGHSANTNKLVTVPTPIASCIIGSLDPLGVCRNRLEVCRNHLEVWDSPPCWTPTAYRSTTVLNWWKDCGIWLNKELRRSQSTLQPTMTMSSSPSVASFDTSCEQDISMQHADSIQHRCVFW